MKTLGVLLLLAVGLGAAYWTTQRPGEGLDELRTEAQALVGRVSGAVDALREPAAPGPDEAAGVATAAPADTSTDASSDASSASTSAAALDSVALSNRLESLENDLTRTMSVAESVDVQSRLDTLDSRVELLDAPEAADRLAGLAERIDTAVTLLNERMDESERARIALTDREAAERATLSERLDTTNARLDTLATEPLQSQAVDGEPGDGTDGSSAGNEPPARTGSSLRGIDAALDARLVSLEKGLGNSRSAQGRVAGLEERLGTVDERLAELSDSDERLAATLARLERSLGAVADDSRALSIDSAQQQISDSLTDLDAEVGDGGTVTDVGELTRSLEATRERVRQLESQLEQLPSTNESGQRAQENQSALESQIAALEQRIVALGERPDPALASSIDEVRAELDELNASGLVTEDELRERSENNFIEYKIYFDKNATAISDEAARVLDSFITQETNRTTGVAIFGFTDRQGPATYNQQLAQRRADNVRSYLIQNGFDFTRIGNVAGLGEDAAAALLDDDQEDAEQRVVVLFASQR